MKNYDLKITKDGFLIEEGQDIRNIANWVLDNWRNQNKTFPTKYIRTVDKVTRVFFKGILNGTFQYPSSGKEQAKYYPLAKIEHENIPNIYCDITNLDFFDKCVFYAIVTLYENGYMSFEAKDIYKVLCGNTRAKIGNITNKDIFNTWQKFTNTQIVIDTGNMGDAYNFKRTMKTGHIIEGNYEETAKFNNGKKSITRKYYLFKEPPLLEYAKLIGQIDRKPITLLDLPVNMNRKNIILSNYLLDRISMYDPKRPKTTNIININSMFEELNIQITSRTQRKRIISCISDVLQFWIEKDFLIDYYYLDLKSKKIEKNEKTTKLKRSIVFLKNFNYNH